MKQVKIIIPLLLCGLWSIAQTVTPNPGPYTPMSQKYQYPWLKTTGGIWNLGKFVQADSAQFSGITYIPDAPYGDSSTRAANTGWVKRNVTGGSSGVTVVAYGKNAGGDSTILLLSNGTRYAARDSIGTGGGTADTVITKFPLYSISGSPHDSIAVYGVDSSFQSAARVGDSIIFTRFDGTTQGIYAPIGGGGGSGITELGTPAYGLTRTNDSTYIVDTTVIASKTYVDNKDALKVNISDTAAMLLPYLRSAIAAATYLDKTASQTAWFVYGNHTSGSAAPTFAKMNINSIDATGTPSSLNFLRGDGAWIAGALSPWLYNGSKIYYNTDNVGIGVDTPSAKLTIVDNSIGATASSISGGLLANYTAATNATTGLKYSPSIVFRGSGWNTTTSAAVKQLGRLTFKGAQHTTSSAGEGEFVIESLNNAGTTWNTVASFSRTFNASTLSMPNGGISTGNGFFTAGVTTSYTAGSSLTLSANINNVGRSIVSRTGSFTVSSGSGLVQRDFEVVSSINTTGGTSNLTGYYFSPTLTSTTGLTLRAFHNVTGDNLFGTTSGSVGVGANTTIAASAILDVTSTTKGVLFPRMTTTEKNAIASPAEGLIVYDLTLHKLCVYTGSAWETVTSL